MGEFANIINDTLNISGLPNTDGLSGPKQQPQHEAKPPKKVGNGESLAMRQIRRERENGDRIKNRTTGK